MANLNLRSFTALVSNGTAAVQASCSQILDFTTGSVIRSIVEASSAVGLWMQEIAVQILQSTRLATSVAADCDTFGLDFGYTDPNRSGIAASGIVTFSRYNGPNTVSVPLLQPDGTRTIVRTFDGIQVFSVVLDTTNLTFNASLQAYVMQPTVLSINVPVLAQLAGDIGNVQPNSITLIASNLPGIDTVTNVAAFTNGVNSSDDPTFRKHFVNWVNSRSLATDLAVRSAVENTQGVVSYSVLENADNLGNTVIGLFTVTVDDGSGNPPGSLITSVSANVDFVRPLGSAFTIRIPTVLTVNITMTLTAQTGFLKTLQIAPVQQAIIAYMKTLGVADDLAYSRLVQIAYDATPGIANVTNVSIAVGAGAGGVSDVITTQLQLIRVGTVTVL